MAVQHLEERSPIMEINTTPLIDVLLVLLIMFIITIPLQSHAVKLDIPSGPTPRTNPVSNMVVITRSGAILWNGRPVTQGQLRSTLSLTQQMEPAPELHLRPDPDARYETVDEVLAIAKRERVRKMGFVGNERYRSF